MTWRDDLESGRRKFRDEQSKARGKTRTPQRKQKPNQFLSWIGENIERVAPMFSGIKQYLTLIKEDIYSLSIKLHIRKKKREYDPLSAAWRQGRGK
jgi:hypothetical protein